MSFQAITWAFNQKTNSSSSKFILVCLANYANESFEAYPSIGTLSELTALDRKTIIVGLDKLEESQLIIDTGKRVGLTKSVKVYQLSDTKNGTSPKKGIPFFRGSSPVFPMKQSQKRDTDPIREPIREPGGGKKPPAKFVRELRIQIEEAEQERQRLKDAHACVTATGVSWNDTTARLDFLDLGKKIKKWRNEMLSL